jgi:hypothetical protein
MLPEFDKNGNLPPGIHVTAIDVVIERFSRPRYTKRGPLSEHLKTFFEFVSNFAVGIYIDGSYITTKLVPNDIDIAVIVTDNFDYQSNFGWRLMAYKRNKHKHHLDIFPFKLEEQGDFLAR